MFVKVGEKKSSFEVGGGCKFVNVFIGLEF